MEALQEYIKKYDIKIPDYVEKSNNSINSAIYNEDINLVKSLIAYRNYLKKMDCEFDIIEKLLNDI